MPDDVLSVLYVVIHLITRSTFFEINYIIISILQLWKMNSKVSQLVNGEGGFESNRRDNP